MLTCKEELVFDECDIHCKTKENINKTCPTTAIQKKTSISIASSSTTKTTTTTTKPRSFWVNFWKDIIDYQKLTLEKIIEIEKNILHLS